MNRLLLACVLGTCALSTWALLPSPTARAAAADVSLSIADARLVEPPTGQKSMIFQVTLSQPWPSNVDVFYSTSKGPNASTAAANTLATPNIDFTSLRDSVTIPAGNTTAQIEVPILADTAVEQDETFTVNVNRLVFATSPPVTPASTATPVPTVTPVATGTPAATAVPTATVTPTATPTPTATTVPTPTATPAPTINIARSAAKGTIVEPVKGVTISGKVGLYNVNPLRTYNSTTGIYTDNFDKGAQLTSLSGVRVLISATGIAVGATTNSEGTYSVLVRPGTYTIQVQNFSKRDVSGTAQFYTISSRTVRISSNSTNNNFYFYGVAGTLGVPATNGSGVRGVNLRVEARPVGASAKSTPIATAVSKYPDFATVSRGNRFFLPALPPGNYTLTFKDATPNNTVTFYYSFPSVTVTVPTSSGVNRPDARLSFIGTRNGTSANRS